MDSASRIGLKFYQSQCGDFKFENAEILMGLLYCRTILVQFCVNHDTKRTIQINTAAHKRTLSKRNNSILVKLSNSQPCAFVIK